MREQRTLTIVSVEEYPAEYTSCIWMYSQSPQSYQQRQYILYIVCLITNVLWPSSVLSSSVYSLDTRLINLVSTCTLIHCRYVFVNLHGTLALLGIMINAINIISPIFTRERGPSGFLCPPVTLLCRCIVPTVRSMLYHLPSYSAGHCRFPSGRWCRWVFLTPPSHRKLCVNSIARRHAAGRQCVWRELWRR